MEFTMSRHKSKSTPKKPKLVRDSFTIPKPEFAAVEILKSRAVGLGSSVKKSELLRAGLKLLTGLSDAAYLDALAAVPTLKTGRPRKEPAKTAAAPGKAATKSAGNTAKKRAASKASRPAAPASPKPSATATPTTGSATKAVRAPRKRAPVKSATARRPAATPRKAAVKKAPVTLATTPS
jgi:hypothetical protein